VEDPRSEHRADEPDATGSSANPGYALGQLARALATSQDHPDAPTRERAERRVSDWLRVFGGMLSGALRVGSRTPVKGTPAWATPRIVQGGFATGDLLAGGPLQPHEEDLLGTLPEDQQKKGRAALNAYYLTEQGLGELTEMLQTGRYRVRVPEEGALLAVAWLAQNGRADDARRVLDEIGPHFASLRFYPVPSPEPPPDDERVRLLDVGDVVRTLEATRTPEEILTQTEALTVWLPFADRLVALFAETVADDLPRLVSQEADGTSVVEGGWPCQVYPDGWTGRARALLTEYERLRAEHTRCGKPERPTSNLARLRTVLAAAADDPARLTGRDVGIVRATLAWVDARRGLPGSEHLARLRAEQARVAALPTKQDWALALATRFEGHPPGNGLDPGDTDAVLAPVTAGEAERFGLPVGETFAEPYRAQFEDILRRATDATPEQHVQWGTISSGETLARVVPRLAARVRSAGFADPALRCLDEAVYGAFRRRRSVLLFNLQHQVKLDELPWMQALEPLREEGAETKEAALDLLRRVVTLALTSFPHQVLPNKLLQEVRALTGAAGLEVPIVDEVAADIFMGTFTVKYLRAAQVAADLLKGTLYERYYGIDYARVRAIDDVHPSKYGPPTSPTFDRLCRERAGLREESKHRWRPVAENGAIIEQEQVLTTHNLAVLFDALGLAETLGNELDELARRCFTWVCDEVQGLRGPRWGQLRSVKNAAYAWRQMAFFLSLLPPDQVDAFLKWARNQLDEWPKPLRATFRSTLDGLVVAAAPASGVAPTPFYGWTSGTHRFLPEHPVSPSRSA
jgi:hypothetical protein